MSWFPNFLNPWAALAAAAIAIPALLVLYFLKLRRREMAVSSTLLWKKAIQDLQVNAPFQKLRRNLLLLLQMLLLALLLLALSRPVSNYTPGAGQMSVFIIDRSASMAARDIDGGKRTRLEEAKRRALDLIESMPKNGTAMVIAMDDVGETVQTLTSDRTALRRAVESIRQTDRKSRLKMPYQFADAQTQFDPEQLRPGGNVVLPDVRVFSDGRVLDDAGEITVRGNVTLEKVGTETAANVAVVALSAKRNYERPTDVQVFARLANFGPEPVETTVQFSVDGEKVDARSGNMLLLPERWPEDKRIQYERDNSRAHGDSVELPLELTKAAVIKVEQMNKEGDVLAADDVARGGAAAQDAVGAARDRRQLLPREGDGEPEPQGPDHDEPGRVRGEGPDRLRRDRVRPLPADEAPRPALRLLRAVPNGLKLKGATDDAGRPVLLEDIGVLDWKRDPRS